MCHSNMRIKNSARVSTYTSTKVKILGIHEIAFIKRANFL